MSTEATAVVITFICEVTAAVTGSRFDNAKYLLIAKSKSSCLMSNSRPKKVYSPKIVLCGVANCRHSKKCGFPKVFAGKLADLRESNTERSVF